MSFLTSSRPVVVVVDDDPLMLTGIAAILTKAGYECHMARDCTAALKAARNLAPDLMILDVELGQENGLELGHYMKADGQLREISILFLSASQAADIVERTRAAGGDYYLARPFDPKVLIEVVDRALWMPHLVNNNLNSAAVAVPRPLSARTTRANTSTAR
jgi:DNA-binding response OmpR family regulator